MPPKPRSRSQTTDSTYWHLAGLVGAMLVAWGIRASLASMIFLADGSVLLGLDDAAYHSRRALYSFVNFPAVLLYDSYIAYPEGSAISFPPLYDWLLGGVARLFGSSEMTFERVVAWVSVFFATVTLLPIYGLGRRLHSAPAGVAAAWIFAVLPASSLLSSVGNVDHHAAVGFLAACWLWSSIHEMVDDSDHRAFWAVLHGIIVAAMALVWSGSLLYIGLGEGARLLAGGILWNRPNRLRAQSGGALVAAVLIAPWVFMAPVPVDGPFSSTALSWLQVLALVGVGMLAAAMAAFESWRPETRPGMRALRALAAGLAIGIPLLATPGLLESLGSGVAFISGDDTWSTTNPELQPLFSTISQARRRSPTERFGWLVFLVPVLPILAGFGLRRRERREPALLVLIWTTVLTILALRQVRFAHDLAPLASIIFAGTLAALRDRIARFLPAHAATLAAGLFMVALLWPALSKVQWPRVRYALRSIAAGGPPPQARLSAPESQIRFARSVRDATPQTSGFLDDRLSPEYGLLVDPSVGHAFLYWSRRPVPANNFGPYLDRQKFDDTNLFFFGANADEAVAALDRLGSRFVVTAAHPSTAPLPYGQRLHRGDGYRAGDPVCEPCLRLVTEGPENGSTRLPMRLLWVPYKLFERVQGARIEIPAPPGTKVSITLGLVTPLDRRFVFELSTEADEDGRARLRVPYSTDVVSPVHATGPYRIQIADATYRLEVSEEAIHAGRLITFETLDIE